MNWCRLTSAVASWLAVWLFASIVASGCTQLGSQTTEGPPPSYPEQEFFDATIRFYQNDKLSAVLKSGKIRKFEKQASVMLDDGVEMNFYDEMGRHTTWLRSDSGRADEVKKDMFATGNVIAKSDSGQTLETQYLRWENRTRRIISDAPVKLTTQTDTLYGTGFVSDEHLKNWKIERPTGVSFRSFERQRADSTLNGPNIESPIPSAE